MYSGGLSISLPSPPFVTPFEIASSEKPLTFPDYRLFLADIRVACEKIERYIAGLDFDGFLADDKTYDAVLRNLAIIGEAVKQNPQDARDLNPNVEWRKIARFRDIVIHHYFGIDNAIVWDIVQNKIPELRQHLATIVLPPVPPICP